MAAPDHYCIPERPANKFQLLGRFRQEANPDKFHRETIEQLNNLRFIFMELGIDVVVLPAKEGLDDLVFEADSYIPLQIQDPETGVIQDIIILSKFAHADRQKEVEHHRQYLEKHWPNAKFIEAPFNLEGTGDHVYDNFRGVIWAGSPPCEKAGDIAAGRTDPRAHKWLQDVTGIPVIGLEMVEPFFHVDTALAPLPSGHMVVYPNGFSAESYDLFKQRAFRDYGLDPDKYLIEADAEDAQKYACNLQCFGEDIVMPECSQELQDRLHNIGYNVHTTPMDNLIASGGGVHCCTNRWDVRHITGGLAAKTGIALPKWYQQILSGKATSDEGNT